MADSPTALLRAYLSKKLVFDLDDQKHKLGQTLYFDRLEIGTANPTWKPPCDQNDPESGTVIVIDALPGTPRTRRSWLRAQEPDAGCAVEFTAHVRSFLTGRIVNSFEISARVKFERQNGAFQGKVERLRFGNTEHPPFDLDKLWEKTGEVPVGFGPGLLEAVGLCPVAANCGPCAAKFVDAPVAALESRDDLVPKPFTKILVVRLERSIRFATRDQRLRVPELALELAGEAVAESPLARCPSGTTVYQTNYVFDDDNALTRANTGRWLVTVRGLPTRAVLACWNASAAEPLLQSFETTDGLGAVSLTPTIDWLAPIPRPCLAPGKPATSPPRDEGWYATLDIADRSVNPDKLLPDAGGFPDAHLWCIQPVAPLKNETARYVNTQFPAFRCQDGTPLSLPWRFDSIYDWEEDRAATDDELQSHLECVREGFAFRLFPLRMDRKDGPAFINRQRCRMGAVDLEYAPDLLTQATADEYKPDETVGANPGLRSLVRCHFPRAAKTTSVLPAPRFLIQIRVERASPGGQDDPPNEPFSSVLAPPSGAGGTETLTRVRDSFRRERPVVLVASDPSLADDLQFTLVARETAGPDQHLLKVNLSERSGAGGSGRPLPVVVIDRQPLLIGRVDAPPLRGLSGADGNREVGNWSSVGFEGASWELAGAADGFALTFPPQAIGEAMEKRLGDSDIGGDKPKPILFRFGHPARFELAASYFRQNFVEPNWNLRRILGYPGQRAPGAGVSRLTFELLYGMTCTVRGAGLRLAELSSRLGAVPGPLPEELARPLTPANKTQTQISAFEEARKAWARQFAAYLSRLGVFEPWSPGQNGSLSLAAGVGYRLRDNANVANPVDPSPQPTKDPPLPGGALWAIEFRSLYESMLRPESRTSTGGVLTAPAFSALGGWGSQRAIFQDGLTTILSDTAMGRVSRYSVERKGRIAGFWNRATHIIIYERSVVPTSQFVDEQDYLPGRPIVRKVREFIRIDQPSRSYPDFDAPPQTCGCVLAIRFGDIQIPVSSRWGWDVLGKDQQLDGYVIPLWRPGENPQVYRKPQISLTVAGKGGPTDPQPFELREPDKLLFYTCTRPGTGPDTDTWKAVCDVDFPDIAYPTPPAPEFSPSDDLDATQPDPAAVEPGYEAFTYAVEAAGRAVDLVASRADKPLAAVLANVSMVRSQAVLTLQGEAKAKAEQFRNATRNLGEILTTPEQALLRILDQGKTKGLDWAKTELEKVAGGLKTDLGKKADDAKGLLKGVLNNANEAAAKDWAKRASDGVNGWRNRLQGFLNTQLGLALPQELSRLAATNPKEFEAAARRLVNDQLTALELTVRGAADGLQDLFRSLDGAASAIQQVAGTLRREADGLTRQLNTIFEKIDENTKLTDLKEKNKQVWSQFLAYVQRFNEVVTRLPGEVRAVGDRVQSAVRKDFDKLAQTTRDVIDGWDKQFDEWRTQVKDVVETVGSTVKDVRDAIQTKANALAKQLTGPIVNAIADSRAAVQKAIDDAFKLITINGVPFQEWEKKLRETLEKGIFADVAKLKENAAKVISGEVTKILTPLNANLENLKAAVGKEVESLKNKVLLANTVLEDGKKKVEEFTKKVEDLAKAATKLEDLRRDVMSRIGSFQGDLREFGGRIGQAVGALNEFKDGLAQKADQTLRLVRAFGESPVVAGMNFARERLGYYFDPLKQIGAKIPIDITPVAALVNRGADALKAIGLRLPATQLLEQIIPPPDELLKNFDFSKLLPDFAGINLANLLPELKAPAGLKDKVKITHDIDKQHGRGWVQADVKIPIAGPSTLFEAGPVKILLKRVEFTASVRVEAGLGNAPQRTQSGQILADWLLALGGTPLVTFRETTLRFDESGRTKFDLRPDKIDLSGVLQMISEVLKSLSDPNAGFTLRLAEKDGLPVGVEAILNLPLPPISAGPCGISGLRFGAALQLLALPEFAIGLRVHLGEKIAPFTVTVFILGGGGWFDASARYMPLSNRISSSLSIGINAGAKLELALGPIRGSVYAYFYVEAEFVSESSEGGQKMNARIGLLLGGEVDVLGLISARIQLLLELAYEPPALVGRGRLSIKIKICWFLTIEVELSVEKRFASIGGGRNNEALAAADSRQAHHAVAADYMNTLE